MAKTPKKGIENLIPANQRTKDELREMTRNGGIKSGEARREKKKLKEELEILMQIATDGTTNQSKLCVALLSKALSGDVQAFNTIRDTMGEKPKEVIEQTNIDTKPFEIKIVK